MKYSPLSLVSLQILYCILHRRKLKMDSFLQKYLDRFEAWSKEGSISHSSRVIPVGTSHDPKQWILPSEQALEILRHARVIGLQNCVCRQHYSHCSNPTEVCLVLDTVAETLIGKEIAREITQNEASEVLRKADIHGLVHLSLYMPDHQVFALCSCCSCCCHDLHLVREHHHREMIAHADYIAVTNSQECTKCMLCVGRCVFNARINDDGEMKYDPAECLGCGLCVSVCCPGATVMERR